jgi:hypothetical protein
MPELLVDFITSLDGSGPRKGGPDGGGSKAPNISAGWVNSPNATTRS